eukprot:NODE_6671_length_491_cov_120.068807.p1 GENE.NODE_6671_length_491_cov_120.068807~~NODE_6671_length_491_cov_120.068807.p1  ORF type:complete len:100 (-),score=45.42 NODE_6671_length_491_cov_120.068807:175-474(-)
MVFVFFFFFFFFFFFSAARPMRTGASQQCHRRRHHCRHQAKASGNRQLCLPAQRTHALQLPAIDSAPGSTVRGAKNRSVAERWRPNLPVAALRRRAPAV